MIKNTNQNYMVYVSEKTQKIYELLLGKTSNNLDSDMLFIFDIKENKVVSFIYGGFSLENIKFNIKNEIEKYENDIK